VPKIETYHEFWLYYLREHGKRETRALHFLGTALAIVLFAAAVHYRDWTFALGAVISGYLFAWIGHFFVERNKPATFTYPLWSLISDFRMFFTFLAGGLEGEYRRHGLQ
jgi:hypothetical protein